MDLGLAGKTVLISGSTAGIGFAAARQFAREGATVLLNGRTEARVAKAAETLRKEIPGATVRGIAADVSTSDGIKTIAAAAPSLALARGLAESTRGTGVTVNSVLPGPTGSEGVGDFVASLAKQRGISLQQMEKEFFATARPSSLLGRFATPEEVANLIVYTASTAASATNGSSLRVDGGVVRSIT